MTADTAAAIVNVLKKLAERIEPENNQIAQAFRDEAAELEQVVLEFLDARS